MTISASAFTANAGSGTSALTASKTWVLDRVYLITVSTFAAGGPATPTVTGATQKANQLWVSTTGRQTLFVYKGDGTTHQKTIDYGGASQTSIQWTVTELRGVDNTGTNGQNALVQVVPDHNSGTTSGVTLAAFGDAVHNGAFLSVVVNASAPTVEGGYTALSTQTSFFSLADEFKLGEDTSPTFTNASAAWGAIGVELKVGSVGAATQLSITTAPTPQYTDTVFTTQPIVAIEDADGTVTADTSTIVATLNAVTVNGVTGITGLLAGTTSKAAVAGSATYTNLHMKGSGWYTLTFSCGVLTPATTAAFYVMPRSAAPCVVTVT